MRRLSLLQAILVYIFIAWNNIFFLFSKLLYDTKIAYEVQKYKCMYDKAYKKHLFSLSQKMFVTQTKVSLV